MPDCSSRLLDLLHHEGRALHALLTRLTLDPHAAEDLMQELFLKLAASSAFAASKNPGAYLRQSAIHIALDWRRAHPRQPTPLGDGGPLDPAPLPGATISQHEQWSRILDAAALLPAQTREAFILHYLHNQSFIDIAAALDKTPHQVRALCHKAISALRARFAAAEEDPCHVFE